MSIDQANEQVEHVDHPIVGFAPAHSVKIKILITRCGDDTESAIFVVVLFDEKGDDVTSDDPTLADHYQDENIDTDDFINYQRDSEDPSNDTFSVAPGIFDSIRSVLRRAKFNMSCNYDWEIIICVHHNVWTEGGMYPFCPTMTQCATFTSMTAEQLGSEPGSGEMFDFEKYDDDL